MTKTKTVIEIEGTSIPDVDIKTYSVGIKESEMLYSDRLDSLSGLAAAIDDHVGNNIQYNLVFEPDTIDDSDWETTTADALENKLSDLYKEMSKKPDFDLVMNQEVVLVRDSTGICLSTMYKQTWSASKENPGKVLNVKIYIRLA